jgi:hypothetical protein
VRLQPTDDTLRSQFDNGSGACHPESWVVEVSSNEKDWEVADRRDDDVQLNEQNRIIGFEMNCRHDPVRCIRLRLTEVNHGNDHEMSLSGWELFGSLREM